MPTQNVQQFTFNAGELSPLILGRQDVDRYARGLAKSVNGIPLVQGGWTRRPGTVFVTTPKFGGSKEARLVDFVFGVDTSFMLEFGEGYIRFFTLDGIVVGSDVVVTQIANGNPATLTATGHGFSDGDRVFISGLRTPASLANREVIVRNPTTNTFDAHSIEDAPIDTSGEDPAVALPGATASAGKILELATPYTEEELFELRFTQSADVVYITHPAVRTTLLSRTAPLTWTLSFSDFLDGPWGPLNDTTTTLAPGSTANPSQITASSTTGINGGDGFTADDVGRLIRLLQLDTWDWYEITNVVSTTIVDAKRRGGSGSTTATADWRLGLWSDETGWPSVSGFHEGRFWAGGTILAPQRLDGSRTDRFQNFSSTDVDGLVEDDRAISITFAAGEINAIEWLQSGGKGLMVGTTGGEWKISASSSNEVLTPSTTTARRVTAHGSTEIQAIQEGGASLFVQRSGRKLRELAFVFEIDGFRAPDLTILSEHITRPRLIHEMTMQRQPQPILWAIRSDGALIGMTYAREQDVVAWHQHSISGVDAKVESVAAIPDPDGISDEVWMVVKRTKDGQPRRSIEVMSKIWEVGDSADGAIFVDEALPVVNPQDQPLLAATGLHHLEGEEVAVWADGFVRRSRVVAGGKITLDASAVEIVVGRGYDSTGQTMPIEGGTRSGSAQSISKNILRVGFWLMDTLDFNFGRTLGAVEPVLLRNWNEENALEATEPFTGVIRERFEGDWGLRGQVWFQIKGPAPATVLSVVAQVDAKEDT